MPSWAEDSPVRCRASARLPRQRSDCRSGCPACVGTAAQVGPEGKRIAERVLTHLAEGPPPEAAPVEAEAGTEPETEPA